MGIDALLDDPYLVPLGTGADALAEESARRGYITIRVPHLLTERLHLQDAADPLELADDAVEEVRTILYAEMGRVPAVLAAIVAAVALRAGSHVALATVRSLITTPYLKDKIVPGTLAAMRTRLLTSIVWRACADDTRLLETENQTLLQVVTERRLRTVERMLYDVAIYLRVFRSKEIQGNPAGPWRDNWTRLFDYPRVPARPFGSLCHPFSSTSECTTTGMDDWYSSMSGGLSHADVVRPPALAFWTDQVRQDQPAGYTKFYNPAGGDPQTAIQTVFEGATNNFRERNLLHCDHVIHLLHIEALLVGKEVVEADRSWFAAEVARRPTGWLRISTPWSPETPGYLVQQNGVFFDTVEVRPNELQVGDHLIVYNHPAYDRATDDVWRLENALVVAVDPVRNLIDDPGVMLQGHGTYPATFSGMKVKVVDKFNKALDRLRAALDVHLKTGSVASLPVMPDPAVNSSITRRKTPAQSEYTSANQKADWWLGWPLNLDERLVSVAQSASWKAVALAVQKIDIQGFVMTDLGGNLIATGACYFPLWEAAPDHPRDSAGKISVIQPVIVTPAMIAGWTWVFPKTGTDTEMVAVIRPRVA